MVARLSSLRAKRKRGFVQTCVSAFGRGSSPSDECKQILGALKKQPKVIGGVVYTVTDAQDYVANAVVNLMLPDSESSEKVYEKGTKRFCDKFHSFFEKEVVAEGESAMYDLAMRETYPEAVEAVSMKKEKKEEEKEKVETFEF